MIARSKPLLGLIALGLFAVACGSSKREETGSSEGMLLPNDTIFETGHDGATYKAIADYFRGRSGIDLHVTLEGFAPAWPLKDDKTVVLNRLGTPILFGQFGYFHTGMDIMRSSGVVSTEVTAPHDGLAAVFDWTGAKIEASSNPQQTVVAIYDPVSHVITQLMHVDPAAALLGQTDPVTVHKGDVIGKLALAPVPGQVDRMRLAHTHVNFVDGENLKLLNPAKLFPYKDTTLPETKTVYITTDEGKKREDFLSGKMDIVVEAADRDDDSQRNLEVSAIAFTIKDQDGNVLSQSAQCNLGDLYESIAAPYSTKAKELIDFGSAATQVNGGWPSSDTDNAARTFRYGLTQLAVENGRCTVKNDADGFLDIPDTVEKLSVEVTLWDGSGNKSVSTTEVLRGDPNAPDPDDGDDDGDWNF